MTHIYVIFIGWFCKRKKKSVQRKIYVSLANVYQLLCVMFFSQFHCMASSTPRSTGPQVDFKCPTNHFLTPGADCSPSCDVAEVLVRSVFWCLWWPIWLYPALFHWLLQLASFLVYFLLMSILFLFCTLSISNTIEFDQFLTIHHSATSFYITSE